MNKEILVWDSERQVFSGIQAEELLELLINEDSNDCQLFLAWMPVMKSVFLYNKKRLEIVFEDGKAYNLRNVPRLYDKLFSLRHGSK